MCTTQRRLGALRAQANPRNWLYVYIYIYVEHAVQHELDAGWGGQPNHSNVRDGPPSMLRCGHSGPPKLWLPFRAQKKARPNKKAPVGGTKQGKRVENQGKILRETAARTRVSDTSMAAFLAPPTHAPWHPCTQSR